MSLLRFLWQLRETILLWVLLIGWLLLSGCSEPWAPREAFRPFHPPPAYARYFEDMRACSGRFGAHFGAISWYVVDDARGIWYDGHWRRGTWSPPHNIYIAKHSLQDSALVAHEILHDLGRTTDHVSDVFLRCGLYPYTQVPQDIMDPKKSRGLTIHRAGVSFGETRGRP
jgi:hypothetical protein